MKLMVLTAVLSLMCGVSAFAESEVQKSDGTAHQEHKDHPHKHAKNCGHKTAKHGDHHDYDHDGHQHKEHSGHIDECDDSSKPAKAK